MSSTTTSAFHASAPWRLSEQVSLRDEAFGALAYHHGNRRLVFLKSRALVDIVRHLSDHESALAAIAAVDPDANVASYVRALASLASSGVLCER